MAAPHHRYDDRRHQASAAYKHQDKRWDNPLVILHSGTKSVMIKNVWIQAVTGV